MDKGVKGLENWAVFMDFIFVSSLRIVLFMIPDLLYLKN